MNFSSTEQTPDDPERMPPARRRRAQRLLAPLDADERANLTDALAHDASPSFDYFLFSLAAGLVLSAGLALDSTALIVLGAALAPLMAPAVGVSVGAVTGSLPFFLRSLGAVLVSGLLVLGCGWLAGLLIRSELPMALEQAHLNAQLAWIPFLVLAVGSVFTTGALARWPGKRHQLLPQRGPGLRPFRPAGKRRDRAGERRAAPLPRRAGDLRPAPGMVLPAGRADPGADGLSPADALRLLAGRGAGSGGRDPADRAEQRRGGGGSAPGPADPDTDPDGDPDAHADDHTHPASAHADCDPDA